jgi:hypothetical protein
VLPGEDYDFCFALPFPEHTQDPNQQEETLPPTFSKFFETRETGLSSEAYIPSAAVEYRLRPLVQISGINVAVETGSEPQVTYRPRLAALRSPTERGYYHPVFQRAEVKYRSHGEDMAFLGRHSHHHGLRGLADKVLATAHLEHTTVAFDVHSNLSKFLIDKQPLVFEMGVQHLGAQSIPGSTCPPITVDAVDVSIVEHSSASAYNGSLHVDTFCSERSSPVHPLVHHLCRLSLTEGSFGERQALVKRIETGPLDLDFVPAFSFAGCLTRGYFLRLQFSAVCGGHKTEMVEEHPVEIYSSRRRETGVAAVALWNRVEQEPPPSRYEDVPLRVPVATLVDVKA